ncbi:MAG: hypothetical protein ACTSQE_06615 [Candidatus Heimdallarchaeaceae archaeon]
MDIDKIRSYLSEPVNRLVLSQLIHSGRSLSASDLSESIPSITQRSSLYAILKRFSELGLIQKKIVSIGSQEREFYSPNKELLESNLYHELLLEYEDLNWPSKLSMDFQYSWFDWPDCLVEGDSVSLYFIYGSYLGTSVDISALTKLLTYWSLEVKGIPLENIRFSSVLDYHAGPYKNKNLIVIGSGEVNKVTADILNLYGDSLPIRFQSKSIVSSITKETYHDVGSSIIGILPNPWNSNRVVILCAGMNYSGTRESLKALIDDLDAIVHSKPRVLANHPQYSEMPIRVLVAQKTEKVLHEKLEKMKSYSFKE